jgi:hypothetical protein
MDLVVLCFEQNIVFNIIMIMDLAVLILAVAKFELTNN